LCKADLVTGMVGEFPELQGVMGGYYARAQGEPDEVADAIRDHYKPVGQGDDVPTAPVTVAVSLADKLDTLVGFFRIGETPTGSRDPFALRRAAIAINSFQIDGAARFSVGSVVEKAIELYRPQAFQRAINKSPLLSVLDIPTPINHVRVNQEAKDGSIKRTVVIGGVEYGPVDEDAVRPLMDELLVWGAKHTAFVQAILNFLADRLKVQQREAGVRHDLIDAVFALGGEDDLVRLLARVKALQAFITTEDGANLLAGYKRAANLLKASPSAPSPRGGEGRGEGAPASDTVVHPHPTLSHKGEGSDVETALLSALNTAEPRAAAAIEAEDFAAAMSALASLRAPIDAFFEGVMVNDPDEEKRAFRLGLLDRFRVAVHNVADFSKIEG
jgi:glycyl-tRNA synthetase beta chain